MRKEGYTLVEVMTVVVAIGILSAMGVSSLQQAAMNARVKDAALNTTAFLERTANEANQRSATLCLKKVSDQRLEVYKSEDCSGSEEFHFEIEPPNKFLDNCPGDPPGPNWTEGSLFTPRLGLSAAPREGHICVQYGSNENYGAAFKTNTVNTIQAMWRLGADGTWGAL